MKFSSKKYNRFLVVFSTVFIGFMILGFPIKSKCAEVHRIGIRTVDGKAGFYDKITDETFIPRGNNYVELRTDPMNVYLVSSLFSTSYHDPVDIAYDFERMQALGYNTARIFVDLCVLPDCIGSISGGLRDDYMDNVVELLELAKRYGIYALLTANWLPNYGGYLDAHEPCRPDFDHGNCLLLSEPGVAAYVRFFQDFVQGLLDRNAPLDIILGYQLRNEVSFENNQPPLNLTSGIVTTANGKTYDMSSTNQKEDMVNEGLIFWANTVRSAILELDPTALVTAGFFAPNIPHEWRPGDWRLVRTRSVLRDSDLDFLDFHPYPGVGLTMQQQAENYGMIDYHEKPIVLGELGAFRNSYDSPAQGAQALLSWQAEACEVGFDGFMLWYWDAQDWAIVGDNVWSPHDGNGEIARVMAPVFQPDPCFAPKVNLSKGQPATASMSLPEGPPENAFDGFSGTSWQAGSHPEQWIEVDLGDDSEVGEVSMLTDQFPAGRTVHQVLGRRSDQTSSDLLHEFDQETDGGQWLTIKPESPWPNIRWVRVLTKVSPSWVSWREINILPVLDTTFLPLPPALRSPFDYANIESGDQEIVWDIVESATSYDVQVALDSSFMSLFAADTGLDATRVTVGSLNAHETYFWRVRANNSTAAGPWSNIRRFFVTPPAGVNAANTIPDKFELHPNYPNPFNAGTIFRFDLPEKSAVKLVVFDILGRAVATVLSEEMKSGRHKVDWQPGNLASGIYFYHLKAGKNSQVERLLLLK